MLIAGILASTFAVLGVSYLQIRKKSHPAFAGAFLFSGDKLLIGANQNYATVRYIMLEKEGVND